MNASELRGTAYLIPSASATGSIPSDKRALGSIVYASASQEYYGYIGATTSSTDWNTSANWKAFGSGSSTGGTSNGSFTNKFIVLASGSAVQTDGGIIVQTAANSGEALYFESGSNRWAVTSSLSTSATSANPLEYVVTAFKSASATPPSNPIYGGASASYGNIYIDSNTGDVYIYS